MEKIGSTQARSPAQSPRASRSSSVHYVEYHINNDERRFPGLEQPKPVDSAISQDLPLNEHQPNGRAEEPKERYDEPGKDLNLVTWSGADDPENPMNWSTRKKWAATFVVSSFTLISPVSSSMVAPALNEVSKDLRMTSEIETQLTLSIFVLAYAIGPLFLGPLSEIFGRVYLLRLSNLFYMAWNLGCGFAQNKEEMIIFRLLSGIGGSAPLAIGGGVLSDCWHPDQRGKAVGIYSLAPLLGPAIGPIAGGFIAEKTTWRWVFWSTSIAAALVQVSGIFFLQETYTPTLLKRRAVRLRKETGNEKLYTEFDSNKPLIEVLKTATIRPFRLLATQPIVQVIAVYMAYLFGLFYLILSTFPNVWEDVYGENVGIGGLNYLSLGIGYGLGSQINAQVNDRIYLRLKRKNNNVARPEFRVPLMFTGSTLIPIGLFWYGWSVKARVHWIMPNIGMAIFAAGSIVCLQCMQTYVIDSYSRYAASGLAAAVVLRSLAGFGFPLFAPYMYKALGYGWGNSVIGFISIVIGLPAPFLFWICGEKLRSKSRYAAG
ncbi:MFS general substrate transporter [Glonium stellatum]|uniref:MFS general substrate transporter n=1 Tax=Glonium stellatum TaxID=574774 RepID=A0A8E2JTA2_9PEZI|nr:MFS general substrate transporter [Glonium stellatum]